jgi:hypothetical protein
MIVLAFSATESLDAAACLMYKAVTSSKICVENKNKPIYICGFNLKNIQTKK